MYEYKIEKVLNKNGIQYLLYSRKRHECFLGSRFWGEWRLEFISDKHSSAVEEMRRRVTVRAKVAPVTLDIEYYDDSGSITIVW